MLQHIQNDDYYPDFEDKLTHLFFSACKFHCFLDGNKRIAITLCAQMLLLNGYLYCSGHFIREMENISYHVAAGNIDKDLLHDIIFAVINGDVNDEGLKLKILNMMREEWRKMGHPVPTYKNDRAWKAFEFFIPELDKEVDMASDLMKAMFGGASQKGTKSGPSRDQVGTKPELSADQMQILNNLSSEQPITNLMAILGRSNRTKFRDQVLQFLIDQGIVEMTIPNKPRSSKQKYRLTGKGIELMQD